MRFAGEIGFSVSYEDQTRPGVYTDSITKRMYYGDTMKNSRRWEADKESIVGDINIGNQFNVVGDPFAFENFEYIKFVMWMGKAWSVKSVEVEYPRLIITVGGIYNGPQT